MTRFITSIRFQLLGALFLAVLFPAFLRGNFTISGLGSGNNPQTMVGVAIAIALGYYFYRRLIMIPGINSEIYIIFSFAASYIAVVLIFFFFRFQYTRTTLLLSFFLATAWIFLANIISRRLNPPRLAIIPGGHVDRLKDIGGIQWRELNTPDANPRKFTGIVADLRADLPGEWVRYIADAALCGVPVFHVKQVRENLTGSVEIEHLSENTLGSLTPNRVYTEIKRLIDPVAALLSLVVFSPVFMVIAIMIKMDSPGPVLFAQKRRGFRGSVFTVYKFRTMFVEDPPSAMGAGSGEDSIRQSEQDRAITKDKDHRITRVGRFLRRTRLDELPQLINVVRGEMSWIGPRPEALVLSQWYESELPFYSYRHIVRPGITGWAQVHQGHVAHVSEVHKKLHYDFYYIKNFSFWVDFVIVILTIKTVISGFGSK